MGSGVRAGLLGAGAATAGVALSLVVLQLWVGTYPLSDRWWDSGYVVLPLAMGWVVAVAARDIGDDRAGLWLKDRAVGDTSRARRYVRRWVALTRTCRAVGFFGIALLPAAAAWSINTDGLPVGSSMRGQLLDIASGNGVFGLSGGWSPPIVGYAVGALVAEALRRRPPHDGSGPRRADLRPRVPAAYMQPLARWGPRGLGVLGLAVAAASAVSGISVGVGPSSGQLALVAAATWAVTELLRWAVVRHRQRATDAEAVALDDAARTTTIHAVSGSAIAIIGQALSTHLHNLSLELGGPLRWVSLVGFVVGLVSLGVWLGYGVGLAWVVRRGPRPRAELAESTS